jgi:16S rRNA C967 or C1407 C5-methylase (RsmB/RsmF family)/NOL1/NOP2/fmu family ribosome biogenesis protein
MQFPIEFIERLKVISPLDHQEILEGFDSKTQFGLRLNPSKITQERLQELILDESLQPISHLPYAYFTKYKERYTKHPLMFTGSYYIQDAGSMAITSLLEVKEDDYVLDVCASPGSKSTHILSYLGNKGYLVANEVTHNRVGRLVENIGLWGGAKALVCSQKTEAFLALPQFFDKILIDAPCSGEGMFGKNSQAISGWSKALIKKCASTQKEILSHVLPSLKVGGEFIYSTCTMAPEENEEIIEWLLKEFGDALELVPLNDSWGLKGGLESFQNRTFNPSIARFTRRITPDHPHFRAQAFFIAKLRLKAPLPSTSFYSKATKLRFKDPYSLPTRYVEAFFKEMKLPFSQKNIILLGFYLYHKGNMDASTLKKLLTLLHPVYVGERIASVKKDRLEPYQGLATGKEFFFTLGENEVSLSYEDALEYIKGKDLSLNDGAIKKLKKGFVIVSFKEFPLGIGKMSQGILKSLFPVTLSKKIL